jgi:paraquat-inducible protein B
MKKASPKAVGGFVLGAVAIAVVAVIVFGSGRLFQERSQMVAFFTGSLQGLRIGAPVQFRGVQIGTVTEIYVQLDPESLDFLIPVILDINLDLIRGGGEAHDRPGSEVEALIERGLRAQLVAQSLVTGQQAVQLDLLPDTPIRMVETDLPYEQVPTVPSRMAEIEQSVGDVLSDISDVLNQLNNFLEENKPAIQKSVANIADVTVDAKAPIADLRRAAADVAEITGVILENREDISRLVENADDTVLSYKSLAERTEAVIAENQDSISQAIDGLNRLEETVSELAEQSSAMLAENRAGIRDFSNEGLYEIRNLAVDAQAAVEQFRRVMEEMERDPARFFLGKPGQVEVE